MTWKISVHNHMPDNKVQSRGTVFILQNSEWLIAHYKFWNKLCWSVTEWKLRMRSNPRCDQAVLRTLSICMSVHTGQKSDDFHQIWAFMDYNTSLNSQMATNDAKSLAWHIRGGLLFFKVICQISRSQWLQNRWFGSYLSITDGKSNLNSWIAMVWHT